MIKNRDEIELQYTWDLTRMYESDEAFEAALENTKNSIPAIAEYQGKISKSAEALYAYLKLEDEFSLSLERLMNYAGRKSDQDTRVAKYQNYHGQVISVYVSAMGASSWATPELLTLDEATLESFYAAVPELEVYRRKLNMIMRKREHTLTPAEEALLAAAGEMAQQPGNIYSVFTNSDMTFPDATDSEGNTHPTTQGSYIPMLYSQDRVLRKSAFEVFYSVYKKYANTCAAVLGSQCKQLKFFADARKYENALAAALDDNEIPTEVYHNLLDSVHRNMPAMHKYTALRKKLLGVDELHYYDLYVPIVGDMDMTFTYDEACELILKALQPMGEDYCAAVKHALADRWIDVYENPGKRSGAYSAGGYGITPYILLNFHGTLNDVFTLIHEMGHSMHTYHSCKTQPIAYSNYSIFVAEVASTCNEALLMQYLLNTTTDTRKRAYLINYFMEQFRATLYRQTMFAEFELKLNTLIEQGQSATSEALCEIYGQLNLDYYGESVVLDDEIRYEWARIPHFYYNYYVYQYATGYAAAIALSEKILSEGEEAVKAYIAFLSGGSSEDPISLLKKAGVDMATSAPVDAALNRFDKLVDELEELMK